MPDILQKESDIKTYLLLKVIEEKTQFAPNTYPAGRGSSFGLGRFGGVPGGGATLAEKKC